jgi:AcrR family transcriptional regulator
MSKRGAVSRQDGVATREHLLDIAEQLFAQEGVAGVSIRAVNAAAGLAPAGVHYHFGSKDALLEEVVRRRGDPLAKELMVGVGNLVARGRRPTADQLVRAFALPMVAVLESDPVRGRYWFSVLAQLIGSHDVRLGRLTARADALMDDAVERTFPEVDAGLRALEWHIGTMAIIQMLSEFGLPRQRPWISGAASLERYVEVVIDFVAGGLAASLRPVRGG